MKNKTIFKKVFRNSAGVGIRSLTRRFVASIIALVSIICINPTAFAENNDANQQPDKTYSFKKSQYDEYEDIIAKVETMSDEEVENCLAKYEQFYKKYKENKRNVMVAKDLFENYSIEKKFSELTKSRKNLILCMHLEAFMKKYPTYFNNDLGKFSEDTFAELSYVKKLSDEEVLTKISFEKNRFEKFGTVGNIKYFKIEKDIENNLNSRIFLLTLCKLNSILEKHNKLKDILIYRLKSENAVFKIHSFDPQDDELATRMYVTPYYFTKKHNNKRINNIFISKYLLNEYAHHTKLTEVLEGFHSYVEADELISSSIAHEMGHVFENLMFDTSVQICRDRGLIDSTKCYDINMTYNNFAQAIKQQIIETAKANYGAQNSKISKYAETNDSEWFAEVFANLECAKGENISPYGKVMQDVLKNFENDFECEFIKSKDIKN